MNFPDPEIHTPTQACDPFASTSSSGFISSEDRQSYISTQFPLSGTIFSSLRHACVRSLSCEVCPGREGPILYGDLEHGFSLSSTFFARDREARGLQRLFSVVVWMRDRSHLVNLTPTLLQLLEPAVFRIRQQSAAAFDASSPAPMSNRLLPSRGVMGFRTATAAAPTRSLATICGDELLFERLHQTFVLLLRAGAACMIEEDVVSKANRVASAVHRDRCQTITWRSVRVAATETVDLFELAEVEKQNYANNFFLIFFFFSSRYWEIGSRRFWRERRAVIRLSFSRRRWNSVVRSFLLSRLEVPNACMVRTRTEVDVSTGIAARRLL